MNPLNKLNNRQTAFIRKMAFYFTLALYIAVMIYSLINYIAMRRNIVQAEIEVGYLGLQSAAAIAITILPNVLQQKLDIDTPDFLFIWLYLLIISGIYLGEMQSFYDRFEIWDSILHISSGVLVTLVGIVIVYHIDKTTPLKITQYPLFVAMFVFMLSCTIGVIWEIFEFTIDSFIVGTNMQRFMDEFGNLFVGRAALMDTMKDLIQNTAGALVASVAYGAYAYKNHTKEAVE